MGLVLACDFVVAETGAKFQLTETSCGLGAAKHWAQFHFRGAGACGDEVSLTGRYSTAEEAPVTNLINWVAPKDTVMETARMLAVAVAANPPLVCVRHWSVRATVRARRWFLDRYTKEAAFQQAPMRLYLTEDFREAALAFKEKRKPRDFQGR